MQLLPSVVELSYPDGGKYIGEVGSGASYVRSGKGVFFYPENDVYLGDWRDDTFDGKGAYLFGTGERYEGDLKGGAKHGQGNYYYRSGQYYSGSWMRDLKDGFGVL